MTTRLLISPYFSCYMLQAHQLLCSMLALFLSIDYVLKVRCELDFINQEVRFVECFLMLKLTMVILMGCYRFCWISYFRSFAGYKWDFWGIYKSLKIEYSKKCIFFFLLLCLLNVYSSSISHMWMTSFGGQFLVLSWGRVLPIGVSLIFNLVSFFN